MTQTQFLMTGKSTKNMNFANSKNQTVSYKIGICGAGKCVVDVKVGGREVGCVSLALSAGTVIVMSTASFGSRGIKPIDITEATAMAKRYFKVS
jgi:hypothetical protein